MHISNAGSDYITEKQKSKKARSEKSVSELETAYIEKLQHYVQNVDKWLERVAKAASSKNSVTYNLGEERKEQIITHLSKKLSTSVEVMRGKKVVGEKFKLN